MEEFHIDSIPFTAHKFTFPHTSDFATARHERSDSEETLTDSPLSLYLWQWGWEYVNGFHAFLLVTRAQSSGREHPRDTTSSHPCVSVSGGELQLVCSFPGNGQWLLLTSASTVCWRGSWPCKGSPCPPSEPCALSLTPCAAGCRGAPLYELLLFFGSAVIIINTLEMCKLHVYDQHKGR